MSLRKTLGNIFETTSTIALFRLNETAEKHAQRWTKNIQKRLSRDTSRYGHRLRPGRKALFPGAVRDISKNPLRNKVYARKLPIQKLRDGKYKIQIRFYGANSKEAQFTNKGLRRPKKASPGRWIGWVDDIFGGVDRGGILSTKSVMDRVLSIYKNTRSVSGVRGV